MRRQGIIAGALAVLAVLLAGCTQEQRLPKPPPTWTVTPPVRPTFTLTATPPPTPTPTATATPTAIPTPNNEYCTSLNRFYDKEPQQAYLKVLTDSGLRLGTGNPFSEMIASDKDDIATAWVVDSLVREGHAQVLDDPLIFMRAKIPDWLRSGQTGASSLIPASSIRKLVELPVGSCPHLALNSPRPANRQLAWKIYRAILYHRVDPFLRQGFDKTKDGLEQRFYRRSLTEPGLSYFSFLAAQLRSSGVNW